MKTITKSKKQPSKHHKTHNKNPGYNATFSALFCLQINAPTIFRTRSPFAWHLHVTFGCFVFRLGGRFAEAIFCIILEMTRKFRKRGKNYFSSDPGSPSDAVTLLEPQIHLNTLRFGGDCTPQSSTFREPGSLGVWNSFGEVGCWQFLVNQNPRVSLIGFTRMKYHICN